MGADDRRDAERPSLGRWFYLLRVRQGLSQEQVANDAGISVATYGRIERSIGPGASMNPRLDTISRLFKAVHAEPADFHALFCVGALTALELATQIADNTPL